MAGRQGVLDSGHVWVLLRSPLPRVEYTNELRIRKLFSHIRQDLGLTNGEWQTTRPLTDLAPEMREILEEELERRIAGACSNVRTRWSGMSCFANDSSWKT